MSVSLEGVNPSQVPQNSQNQASNQGSYAGRTINWLNNTASGRLVKAVGWGAASVALAAITALTAIKGIALIVFGAMTLPAGGALPLALGMIVTGAASVPLMATIKSVGNMVDNLRAMNRLAAAGH